MLALAFGIQKETSAQVEFVIPMTRGWNMISAPVIPVEPRIEVLFREIVRRDNLIILKEGDGHFYIPGWGFINTPPWDFRQGYQVNLDNDDTLIIRGEMVNPETPIQLIRGWNMTAYFPEGQVTAETAFANIANALLIAKDGFGKFYVPEYNFYNMEELRRGRGYLVKVREAVDLIWNSD